MKKTEEENVKKGTWKEEEDQILRNYVNTNGAREWNSIRSQGLLNRTAKSCRQRWVNILRPDLKTGCKFSEEEERIVIELQSKLGNKWAKIATSLIGRTDNDVKNFWSRRQKKLSRIHLRPYSSSSSYYVAASKGKTVKSSSSSVFFEEEITNNVVVDEALKLPEPSIDVDPRYVSYHEEPCVFLNVFKHQSNNYVLM